MGRGRKQDIETKNAKLTNPWLSIQIIGLALVVVLSTYITALLWMVKKIS